MQIVLRPDTEQRLVVPGELAHVPETPLIGSIDNMRVGIGAPQAYAAPVQPDHLQVRFRRKSGAIFERVFQRPLGDTCRGTQICTGEFFTSVGVNVAAGSGKRPVARRDAWPERVSSAPADSPDQPEAQIQLPLFLISCRGASGECVLVGAQFVDPGLIEVDGKWAAQDAFSVFPVGKGWDIEVNEFDFRDNGGVVYDKNGKVLQEQSEK